MTPRTHLLMAITTRDAESVAKFSKRADLTQEFEDKNTPIQLATRLQYWDCVDAIAKNTKTDADDLRRYRDALTSAIKGERIDSVRILLAAGTPTNLPSEKKSNTFLHMAIQKNNVPILNLLLAFDCDLTRQNSELLTPMELAAKLKHWDCVEAIAKQRKTDSEDKANYGMALLETVNENRIITTQLLLEAKSSHHWHYTSGNNKGDYCLHRAIKHNNSPMIALLLSFGFDPAAENKESITPLQLARDLDTTCLQEGWQIYHRVTCLKITWVLIIQSLRQPHSCFAKIPLVLHNKIFSFLHHNSKQPGQTFADYSQEAKLSAQHFLVKISTTCFLTAYPRFFQEHSPQPLITDLEKALKTPHDTAENIRGAVDTFLKDSPESKEFFARLKTFPEVTDAMTNQLVEVKNFNQEKNTPLDKLAEETSEPQLSPPEKKSSQIGLTTENSNKEITILPMKNPDRARKTLSLLFKYHLVQMELDTEAHNIHFCIPKK